MSPIDEMREKRIRIKMYTNSVPFCVYVEIPMLWGYFWMCPFCVSFCVGVLFYDDRWKEEGNSVQLYPLFVWKKAGC